MHCRPRGIVSTKATLYIAVISLAGMTALKIGPGAAVISVQRAGFAGHGDALTTHQAGLPLCISTADCLPIVLYDIRSKGAEAYLDLAKEVMAHEKKGARQGALRTSAGS